MAEATRRLHTLTGLPASGNCAGARGHCHCAAGILGSAKPTLPHSTGMEPGRRGGGSHTKTGHGSLPAVSIRRIPTLGRTELLAVCCVYSNTAGGSFKTEKLKNKTGGSPTTELFGESFLQFFHCQSQLRAVCYGEVTREEEDKHVHARKLK